MDVNLEYYRIFYYIGKYKGITKAAQKLSITQPAVSQALKQLEQALGTSLFIRTTKGVEFTKEGAMLYHYVAEGYKMMEKGEKMVLQMLNLDAGEIHIGASDMTLQFYLLPYLENFHENYPKIKINVTNGPTPETLEYLKEGKIDFGVVTAPFDDAAQFEVKPVKEIEDVFVAGEKFKALKGKVFGYEKLLELPLMCLEKNTSTRRYVDSFLRERNLIYNPEFELATSDILVQFALKNMGVACVVKNFTEEYLSQGKLFELRFKEQLPPRKVCVVTAKNGAVSTAAERLLEMLE